ncbi:alpha-mannosidase [Dictyobacter aurantiacus]|uniref:Alpha-mannosidase n=1 Tax=Dictyobacter aurantiacus TaxID=1936993 RepID=A0A401ZQJ8_9CHLR|nr:alpha-mannosidase [Dictyobacter aurantiacus]GCE09090.1 alpha-mannosidase [Dictyobacter aurantiacus]
MPYHYLKTPGALAATLQRIEKAIYTPLAELHSEAWITPEPVPFAERQSGRHATIALGQSWGKLWDCAWFHFTGQVPEQAAGQAVVLLIDLSGEACVVDANGDPVQGLTTVSSEFDYSLGRPGKHVFPLTDCAQGGENIDLWADAGCNDLFGRYQDSGTLKEAHVALLHEELYHLYYDFEVLHELMTKLSPDSARQQRILFALSKADGELVEYTPEEASRARAILAPELAKSGGTPSLRLSAIGHAHIDLAWLWPIRETIRKGARTFSTALALLDRYPEYIFGASQPQLYQWMKDYYPQLFQRIAPKVAEGRWETQGAMWVEPDTNISGGEALVRQIIYGKRFFREEFGTEPKMLWLPDVFGYSGALPQILKKADIDYFLTIKLSWNTYNVFPHHTFYWQGIDGSRVLAHMPPEGTYNSSAAPRALLAAEKNFADKAISEYSTLLFGIGDGGGGPGVEHLERLAREKNLAGLPPVKQEPIETFFERIASDTEDYQTWVGELYLEKHQGTYTTQARNKRFNRTLELALRELEFAAVLAARTPGYTYPTRQLDAIWKEVLLYQFHDILPGSSITRVYDESLARYEELSNQVQDLTRQARATLLTQPGTTEAITLFNSLSWERQQWLRVEGEWYHVTVPALGYVSLEQACGGNMEDTRGQLEVSANMLQNDTLRVQFAPDGSIQSIFDKVLQREVLESGAYGNRLALYHDEGDAWDFPIQYDEQMPHHFKLEEMSVRVNGPQAIAEQHYSFGKSTLRQRIILTAGSPRLDFVTHVNWQESHTMLRTSFLLAVNASEATCDIQFGSIKRPTHRNTSWDMARYEICAHKWIDLSQWDSGVALLNDCKYGHKVTQNTLDLNLLRSPSYPDPVADRAEHDFTYALYPHAGNHITGNVVRAGYELNVPIQYVQGEPQQGSSSVTSFAQLAAENVIIETMKKAEDGDDIIIRLYEASGSTTRTTLTINAPIKTASSTNLLEVVETTLPVQDNTTIELNFNPFEIVTLRIQI